MSPQHGELIPNINHHLGGLAKRIHSTGDGSVFNKDTYVVFEAGVHVWMTTQGGANRKDNILERDDAQAGAEPTFGKMLVFAHAWVVLLGKSIFKFPLQASQMTVVLDGSRPTCKDAARSGDGNRAPFANFQKQTIICFGSLGVETSRAIYEADGAAVAKAGYKAHANPGMRVFTASVDGDLLPLCMTKEWMKLVIDGNTVQIYGVSDVCGVLGKAAGLGRSFTRTEFAFWSFAPGHETFMALAGTDAGFAAVEAGFFAWLRAGNTLPDNTAPRPEQMAAIFSLAKDKRQKATKDFNVAEITKSFCDAWNWIVAQVVTNSKNQPVALWEVADELRIPYMRPIKYSNVQHTKPAAEPISSLPNKLRNPDLAKRFMDGELGYALNERNMGYTPTDLEEAATAHRLLLLEFRARHNNQEGDIERKGKRAQTKAKASAAAAADGALPVLQFAGVEVPMTEEERRQLQADIDKKDKERREHELQSGRERGRAAYADSLENTCICGDDRARRELHHEDCPMRRTAKREKGKIERAKKCTCGRKGTENHKQNCPAKWVKSDNQKEKNKRSMAARRARTVCDCPTMCPTSKRQRHVNGCPNKGRPRRAAAKEAKKAHKK